MKIVVVSGLSGAGKSICLGALADVGYYCVDNLPVPLVPALVDVLGETHDRVAIGVDSRDAEYLGQFGAVYSSLGEEGHDLEVLFLDASLSELVRRYSETRRRHPMGELPVAVQRELRLVAPLRDVATAIIDTSELTGRQLRRLIRDRYGRAGTVSIALMSFGFRNGLPSEADYVTDVRFLKNPHDDLSLRALTGLHEPVSAFVLGQEDAVQILTMLEELLRFVVPRVLVEGRSYLTCAIGCTGGQHRSVALVQELRRRLAGGAPLGDPEPDLLVRHRDVAGGIP